jgi:hypothetical protein
MCPADLFLTELALQYDTNKTKRLNLVQRGHHYLHPIGKSAQVALNNNHSLTRGGGKHEYRISLFCNKNHFNYLNYVLYLLQLKFIPRDIVDVMKSLRTSSLFGGWM